MTPLGGEKNAPDNIAGTGSCEVSLGWHVSRRISRLGTTGRPAGLT